MQESDAAMQRQSTGWEQQTAQQQWPPNALQQPPMFGQQLVPQYTQQPTPQFGQQPTQQPTPQMGQQRTTPFGLEQFPPNSQQQRPQFGGPQLPQYGQQSLPMANGTPQQPVGPESAQFGGDPRGGVESWGSPPPQTSPVQSGSMQYAQQQLVDQPEELYPEQFADHLTEEMRVCLDDCIDVSQVAAWTADRCIEDGVTEADCARLCNEVSILGAITSQFISRDAENIPAVIDAYIETAETALAELERHDRPYTNEAVAVIDRSIESTLDALETR